MTKYTFEMALFARLKATWKKGTMKKWIIIRMLKARIVSLHTKQNHFSNKILEEEEENEIKKF